MSLELRGRAGLLAVPILLIPSVAVGAYLYYRERLPEFCEENAAAIFMLVGGAVAGLLFAAAFLRARRAELSGGRLRYRSWLSRREMPVALMRSADFEVEHDADGPDSTYLVITAHDGMRLRFNLHWWDNQALRRLAAQLRAENPGLRLSPGVERFVARG